MARKIIWSYRAQEDRKAIFRFWNEHNKSKEYSRKLNGLFKEALVLLAHHPHIGRKTAIENVHVKVIRQYLIIYEIREHDLVVLSIWDGRRNPETMP
jgi:toxin YoeB